MRNKATTARGWGFAVAALLAAALALALFPGIALAQEAPPADTGAAPAAEQPEGQE